MGLNEVLARAAAGRVAVLVVPVPGWATTRFAVERTVRERGWRPALSPADADLLVTCGPPGRRLAAAIDLVWEQMPGPRARASAMAPSAVAAALDQGVADLLDGHRQHQDAAARPDDPVMGVLPTGDDAEPGNDSGDREHEDDHSGEDDGGGDGDMDHGDMDHGDMDMAPGGIPLAEGGEGDRDGLDLDVLHLPLGPVLPHWPAGLLLHCTVSGDVVTDARPELLEAAEAPPGPTTRGAVAERLDRAAGVLALAGWDAAAVQAVRLRDDLLVAGDPRAVAPRVAALAERVRRSRLFRWSLRGAGPIDVDVCRDLGLDARVAGDVHDRLVTLLTDVRSVMDGGAAPEPVPVDVLRHLLPGLELGAVRLLVAGLDLDTEVAARAGTGAR